MANYEFVEVTCNNKKLNDFIQKKYEHQSYGLTVEDDIISFKNREGISVNEIKEISNLFEDSVIKTKLSLESEMYQRIYEINFKNGEVFIKDISIQYSIGYQHTDKDKLDKSDKDLFDKVYKSLVKIYSKIDTKEQDEMGQIIINDNIDKEILALVEVEGYDIVATKKGSTISILEITNSDKFIGVPF